MSTPKLPQQQLLEASPHHLLDSMARGFTSLRHRNFRLFWGGQLISLIGTWMQGLGQQWLVYVLTGSALKLGIVSAFQFLPVLLFSLFGGVVVDRVPKRTLILCTQTASLLLALILGLLTWAGVVQIWHIYLLAFLLGTVNAFDMPARQAFIVEMVGREDLMNAIALNSSIFNGSRVLGPAAGAYIIGAVGIAGCFFLNALSFVAVIVSLLLMHLPPSEVLPPRRNVLRQIGEGLDYIRRDRRVLLVFLLVSFISIFAIPGYSTLMPLIADRVLHVGVTGLGTLTSCLALGALIAALALAYTNSAVQRRFFLTFGALTGVSLLLVFSFSRSFTLSMVTLAGVGFCVVATNATGNTIIQSYVPDHLRGRVMSVWSLVLVGLAPFGSFFAGSVAERAGTPFTIRLGALICLAAALVIVPQIIRHRAPHKQPPPAQTAKLDGSTLSQEPESDALVSDVHSGIKIIEHEGMHTGD